MKPRAPAQRWTAEDTEYLRLQVLRGVPPRFIAAELGREYHNVHHKIDKLRASGLLPRGQRTGRPKKTQAELEEEARLTDERFCYLMALLREGRRRWCG